MANYRRKAFLVINKSLMSTCIRSFDQVPHSSWTKLNSVVLCTSFDQLYVPTHLQDKYKTDLLLNLDKIRKHIFVTIVGISQCVRVSNTLFRLNFSTLLKHY